MSIITGLGGTWTAGAVMILVVVGAKRTSAVVSKMLVGNSTMLTIYFTGPSCVLRCLVRELALQPPGQEGQQ
jgi:hypothetical protein